MKLYGKHAVVTGGASGIGRALCRRFAKEGVRGLVVSDLDGEGAASVAQELGALAVATDVAKEPDLEALIERAEQENGPIDLFFSNAGIGTPGSVDALNDAWQRTWDVNLMAHVYAARALLPRMLERGDGYLVSPASAAGLLTHIGSAPYAVPKHAAVALAEWLSVTYGNRGIKGSVLCPQAVRTAMTAGNPGTGPASVDGMLEPEEVADCVVRGLAEERFLILPHPEVEEYMRRKVSDYDRWLRGMRRLQDQFLPPS